MPKQIITLFFIILLGAGIPVSWTAAEVKPPTSVGGITLGTSIEGYNITVQENFLKEVTVLGLKGFRKGFITYGTCDRPGEIVRIKLKYDDKSLDFYENLLKKYKKKFGSKPKYVGDSFGNFKAWKWSFSGTNNKRTTLVLQHNLRDEAESIGNSIKLNLPDQLNAERECSNQKSQAQAGAPSGSTNPDWEQLLPD